MVDELRDQKGLTEQGNLVKAGRKWRGNDTWQCTLCTYNDTDYERTLGHVGTVHYPEEPPKQRIQSTLVDPHGRPYFMEG